MSNSDLDIQGHRGCRGLYPENTLVAFQHALDIGVTTLELDVIVNRDEQLVVSHEPYFSHEITTKPDGSTITLAEEKEHNLYRMSQDEIEQYDVGMLDHKRFPRQKKIAATKPLLKDVISLAESQNSSIRYNIEIKRKPPYDNVYHPSYDVFAELLESMLLEYNLSERASIQSFDIETLQYLHHKNTPFSLIYLVENNNEAKLNISLLGFVPTVYSPRYDLVDEALITYCKTLGMKVIPWTVNESIDIERMLNFGVDGIISDYPDSVFTVLEKLHK